MKRLLVVCAAMLFLMMTSANAQEFMKFSDVVPGMRGYVRTTVAGDTPSRVSVRVVALNIIRNGIAVVTIRATDKNFIGFGKGSSGSPFYIDGKLVGAVAYQIGGQTRQVEVVSIERMVESFDRYLAAHPEIARERGGPSPLSPGDYIAISEVAGSQSWTGFGTVTYVRGNLFYALGHSIDDVSDQAGAYIGGIRFPVWKTTVGNMTEVVGGVVRNEGADILSRIGTPEPSGYPGVALYVSPYGLLGCFDCTVDPISLYVYVAPSPWCAECAAEYIAGVFPSNGVHGTARVFADNFLREGLGVNDGDRAHYMVRSMVVVILKDKTTIVRTDFFPSHPAASLPARISERGSEIMQQLLRVIPATHIQAIGYFVAPIPLVRVEIKSAGLELTRNDAGGRTGKIVVAVHDGTPEGARLEVDDVVVPEHFEGAVHISLAGGASHEGGANNSRQLLSVADVAEWYHTLPSGNVVSVRIDWIAKGSTTPIVKMGWVEFGDVMIYGSHRFSQNISID